MDSRVLLAASLLDKGLICHQSGIKHDFCHICWSLQESKRYMGQVFDNSQSWLICDECISKVTSVPKEKMFLDDDLLKRKIEEDDILQKQLTPLLLNHS